MIGIFVTPRRRVRKNVPPGQPDLTAPVLSGLVLDQATLAFEFISDDTGACHWLVDSNPGYADADAVVAAKSSAPVSGSALAMVGTNTGQVETSGLPAGNWNLHIGVVDPGSNPSNVLSTAFSYAASSPAENLQLNGDVLEWNGDQLIFNAA